MYLFGILLVVLAVALPIGALAAKAQEFDVTVRNRTGHPAEVKVVGADGLAHMFSAPAGFSKITLPEGVQSYWVSSACGNDAGTWNLNVNKTLWIDCTPTGGAAWLAKKPAPVCGDTGLFVHFGPNFTVFYSQTNWDNYDRGSYYPYEQFFEEYIVDWELYTFGCESLMNYAYYEVGPNTP